MKKLRLDNKNGSNLVFLLLSWVFVQATLFFQNGIFTTLEATKYINEAQHYLETGAFSTYNFYLYATQILIIAAALKLQLGYIAVVIFQWALNLLATYSFYQLAFYIHKNKKLATIATFILIISLPYQVYNSFLYTESIFFSLTLIYTSYLLRLESLSFKSGIFILFFLVLLCITRPTGILFFGATSIYIFFRFLNEWSYLKKFILITTSLLLFILIANSMVQSGGELNLMLPFVRENIICGVNTSAGADINVLKNDTSLYGLLYYITQNPIHFLGLAWLKTISFFGITRAYYSFFHNVLVALFYYPFYIMAIYTLWKKKERKNPQNWFFLSTIFLFWFTTILTCDDWHGRWFLSVTPFLYLLAMKAFIVSPNDNHTKE